MTDLFKVTVSERDSVTGRVLFLVEVVYDDADLVTDDFAFAFQLLLECLRAVMLPWTKAPWGVRKEDLPPVPDPPLALTDDVNPRDYVGEGEAKRISTAYLSEVAWDAETNTLIVTPTHPAWTEHCRVGLSFKTAAYITNYGQPPMDQRAEPLKPVDRTVPAQLYDDYSLGFERRRPKREEITEAIPIATQLSKAYLPVPIAGINTGTVASDLNSVLTLLKYMPVLYQGYGSNQDVGTVVDVTEGQGNNGLMAAMYYEGPCSYGTSTVPVSRIVGRAVLVKPRIRLLA